MEAVRTDITLKWIALFVTCAGAYMDLKHQKIPNKLTMPSILLGVLLNNLFKGLDGLAGSLAGIAVGFSFFLLFALGALKAGDVKLYMALGALGGWFFCVEVMVCSVLIGGVVSLCIMITRRQGRDSLRSLWNYGINLLLTRQFHMYKPYSEASYFSFGCCICAGTAVVAIIGSVV